MELAVLNLDRASRPCSVMVSEEFLVHSLPVFLLTLAYKSYLVVLPHWSSCSSSSTATTSICSKVITATPTGRAAPLEAAPEPRAITAC